MLRTSCHKFFDNCKKYQHIQPLLGMAEIAERPTHLACTTSTKELPEGMVYECLGCTIFEDARDVFVYLILYSPVADPWCPSISAPWEAFMMEFGKGSECDSTCHPNVSNKVLQQRSRTLSHSCFPTSNSCCGVYHLIQYVSDRNSSTDPPYWDTSLALLISDVAFRILWWAQPKSPKTKDKLSLREKGPTLRHLISYIAGGSILICTRI